MYRSLGECIRIALLLLICLARLLGVLSNVTCHDHIEGAHLGFDLGLGLHQHGRGHTRDDYPNCCNPWYRSLCRRRTPCCLPANMVGV